MNQTSPLVTGGATITVATLDPLVSWALTGFHAPMPVAVPGVVAALLMTGAHALVNLISSRRTASDAPKQ
ncbi:hypothetical protein WJ95_09320 [Burkholderia ubonensis]|uniref:hypothetical protein n=1 Tax=Burkholderia ubonensis TaxID=101571 RepID=UPI00075BF72C|nr:hypothetical protein [Burkholderia ubonensis]KVP90697.1 hypothetical protein WJ95_09320 [Burkholderia ubonensis]